MLELFTILGIPSEFTTERTQAVCHSFGQRTDEHGSCSWFHFLHKNININRQNDNALPLADYSWHRSGFFLRVHNEGEVTLACFCATREVRKRLEEFIATKAWHDVPANPYILFDVILDGLYFEADNTVWNMNDVFGPLEHLVLEYAHTKGGRNMGSKIPFTALHNCAKHIIYIAEALESCILVVDATLDRVSVEHQLKECLRYRRSLYRSTQLRLQSLQKRIDNAITLSFNLVTQQDSMVMIQDSNSMKIIAAITMIFLPTTGVATVIGSQLFLSEVDETGNTWRVLTTPLFWLTWKVAIPLTAFVMLLAAVWHWWTHHESPHRQVLAVVRRATTFSVRGEKPA